MAGWLSKPWRTGITNWKQGRRVRPTFQSLEDRLAMAGGMYLNHTSYSASAGNLRDAPAITLAAGELLALAPPLVGEIVLDEQTALIPDAPTPGSPFDPDEASVDFNAQFGDYHLPVADPLAEFVPETAAGGGVKPLNYNTADRLAQGSFQIKARLISTTNSEALFGAASNQAYSVDNGYAVRQDFTKGSFLWSPDTGAHFISNAILWKYDRIDHRYLYPATDSSQLAGWQPGSPRGGEAAAFNDFFAPLKKQTMTIVHSPAGPYVIEGAIRGKWLELGAGRLGVPMLDSNAMGGGKEQLFWFRGLTRGAWDAMYSPTQGSFFSSNDTNRALITWHKDVGAHVMFEYGYDPLFGARFGSLNAWTATGGASGVRPGAWGFPTHDEYYVDDNGRGRHTFVTHFMNPNQGGAKMAIAAPKGDLEAGYAGGFYVVKGAIYGEWMRRGFPFVGLPIEQEQDLGTHWSQLFQLSATRRTQIDVHKASGTIFVSTQVKTVEGKYVTESTSSSRSAFTIEEPTLSAEREVVEMLAYHRAPALDNADEASFGGSFLDGWSERLKIGLESQVNLFSREWDGVLLDAETVVEDDISWFMPLLDEESSDAAVTDIPMEDAELEIAVDEVFSDWQTEDAELDVPAPLEDSIHEDALDELFA